MVRTRVAHTFATAAAITLALAIGAAVPAGALPPRPGTPASTAPLGSAPAPTDAQRASIRRLYLAYFHREPDGLGLTYWSRTYAAGRPLAAISEHFARSDEFRTRYGQLDNADFVELIYANVLDRSSDPVGLAHWTRVLDSGRSRGSIMLAFSESAEFIRLTTPT